MHYIWAIATWAWRFPPFHEVKCGLQYFQYSTWTPPLGSGFKNIPSLCSPASDGILASSRRMVRDARRKRCFLCPSKVSGAPRRNLLAAARAPLKPALSFHLCWSSPPSLCMKGVGDEVVLLAFTGASLSFSCEANPSPPRCAIQYCIFG